MSKEVYIRLRDGEKESELKVESIGPEHQLALMDGLFKFFDLDVDFKEMAKIYHVSGKAYKDFYEKMEQEEQEMKEVTDGILQDAKPKIDTTKYEETLKESNTETRRSEHESTSKPNKSHEHFITGIKYDLYENPLYKCRYKCDNDKCRSESNHYIRPKIKTIKCYDCQTVLKVRPATAFGDPEEGKNPEMYRDSNGNFYIAGAFEMDIKTLADVEDGENVNV